MMLAGTLALALAAALAAADAPAAPAAASEAPKKSEKSEAVVVDCIAAVVNKSIVLGSEVEGLLEQMNQADPIRPGADVKMAMAARRTEILDSLIAEKLLEEEVRKLRIDVTDAEVERVVKGTMEEHRLDEAGLRRALQQQGLSLEEYREGLKKQLTKMKIIQLKVKNRVQVTDKDAEAALAKKKAMDANEFRVRARHILFIVPPGGDGVEQERAARAALARLQQGEEFAALAKELSQDPGSKDRGGDLGEFGRNEMVPEFERAAFTAEPGKVVGPVKSPFGWHIIRVDERVAAKPKSEQAALEDIRNRLYGAEIELQFRAYLDELKRAAHIEKRSSCSA